MSDLSNYIQMLEESLVKKKSILTELQALCIQQEEVLLDSASSPDDFIAIVDKKAKLIDAIATLDAGFEQVFAKVETELNANRAQYADAIRRMQELIRDITDRSTSLQVKEKRNQELAREKFTDVRSRAKRLRKGSKVVSSYYQSMMRAGNIEPQFLDSKK